MSPETMEVPEGAFEAFIYDCDGTLVDTMPLHYEAWSHSLKENGATFPFTLDDFHGYGGVKEQETVVALNGLHGTTLDPERVYRAKEAYFTAHLVEVKPIPAVVEHARYWKERKPVAVASGSPREHVELYLRMAGMEGWFPHIITPADVVRGKPAPDMFWLAAERMGADPARCLVFEDAQGGWAAAEAAGMSCVKVPRRAVLLPGWRQSQSLSG